MPGWKNAREAATEEELDAYVAKVKKPRIGSSRKAYQAVKVLSPSHRVGHHARLLTSCFKIIREKGLYVLVEWAAKLKSEPTWTLRSFCGTPLLGDWDKKKRSAEAGGVLRSRAHSTPTHSFSLSLSVCLLSMSVSLYPSSLFHLHPVSAPAASFS